ncbi:uncharacterized protein LOC103950437 [Pyrus x bretschneideri]|uniref:uncharacterized protein LOC103950437 n=1 Tax=Pyrus x bretschneideri TaxID=225117 RepID=UPI002030A7D1|nr:uncharacterized protein LOC103950437 [Pyrus x bretschneideri]
MPKNSVGLLKSQINPSPAPPASLVALITQKWLPKYFACVQVQPSSLLLHLLLQNVSSSNNISQIFLSSSADKASVRLQSFECRALGEGSQSQNSLAETVYQGVYGPWYVDSTDVREVILYRSGLVTAATSVVVAASAAFLPDCFFLTGILKHNLDFVYAIGAGAAIVSDSHICD